MLGLPLDVDEQIVDRIRARFARRGLTMPDDQPAAGDGAARRDRPRQPATAPRRACGSSDGRHGDRAAARSAARDDADARGGDSRAARADARAARGLFRRVLKITGRDRVRRRCARAAGLPRWRDEPSPITTTILAVMGQIELHLTASARPRRGADAALDAARARSCRRCSAPPSTAPTAGRSRWSSAICCASAVDDRRRRVVHRRAADVAADRRAGQLRLRRARRRVLQQRVEDELLGVPEALIASTAPSASRWPGDGGRVARAPARTSASASPESPGPAAARPRSRSAPSRSRGRRPQRRVASGRFSSSAAATGEVPGDAGGAEHAAADAADDDGVRTAGDRVSS